MLQNKIVLITGATGGIGTALCKSFAKEKATIIINYLQNDIEANKIKEQLFSQYQTDSMLLKANISDEQEVKNMIDKIIDNYHKIDVIINNAGIAFDSLIEDKTSISFQKILSTNLIGPFLVSKYASKYMPSGSSIINISSTNAIDSYYPYSLDYDASKAGLNNLTHNLACAYAPKIRVNAICPGWVETKMNQSLTKEFKNKELSKILLERFATPEEIANVALFLASPSASYINSSIIKVDGGIKIN